MIIERMAVLTGGCSAGLSSEFQLRSHGRARIKTDNAKDVQCRVQEEGGASSDSMEDGGKIVLL